MGFEEESNLMRQYLYGTFVPTVSQLLHHRRWNRRTCRLRARCSSSTPATQNVSTLLFLPELAEGSAGYAPLLYPDLTYGDEPSDDNFLFYEGKVLDNNSTLFLGPLALQSHTSLISFTVPINNNTSRKRRIRWFTWDL
ncbi:hypothetical protein Z517_09248 [Fonsecaea pedrosoi CBS 271.37]|uniref:Uncharacterized protein n=1 Tax=Fonsecaea pedrosoi CBS 271.37 TaxID=1442368 RepID=A0A0D2GWR4_9EURO|nr:uncharacterized protein Z517_09248 [Fonsecaea pedrosoi CBS 271.37]KIW76804.1 hypothetical protein Z517_09248 [Fonsecaea pedrosoi CBS 271.37]